MIQAYFNDLEKIVQSRLRASVDSVKIAMGWLNFSTYGPIFLDLLSRGVSVEIVIDGNPSNYSQENYVSKIKSNGAKIKFLKIRGIMHHKFCIIDSAVCMFGSFNWTNSAEKRNIEDLNICNERQFVSKYEAEFKALMDLTDDDFKCLMHPSMCPSCNAPIVNLAVIEVEGDDKTKITILSVCGCRIAEVCEDYYDISVYNNYQGILQQYDEQIQMAEQNYDLAGKEMLIAEMYHTVGMYLSSFRFNRLNQDIIHAVGVPSFGWYNKHEDYPCYKIIWKERGMENVIPDELPRDV